MQATDLYRLVYVSHRAPACDDEEVERILATSRARNRTDSVVGALLVSDRLFAQVLEGSHDAVQETFERIGMDERHRDPLVLSFERVEQRCFDGWSMARASVNDAAIDINALLRSAGSTEAARLTNFARDLVLSENIVRAA